MIVLNLVPSWSYCCKTKYAIMEKIQIFFSVWVTHSKNKPWRKMVDLPIKRLQK